MPTTTGLATSFINFSRPGASGGGATVTDSDGKIKWAGHNLLTNSESFDNTNGWAGSNRTVSANTQVAPSGATTADTVTTTDNFASLYAAPGVTPGASYTFAFWAKRGTMTDVKLSVYDLTNNANIVAATSYYSSINASTWTLVTQTFTAPAGCQTVWVYPIRDSGVTGTIHLWGAHLYRSDMQMQLNPAMPAGMQSYYPTTPRNLVGYSEDFNSWTKDGTTVSTNAVIAPNGLQTADAVLETATTGEHSVYQSITASSGQQTLSFYAKAGLRSRCHIRLNLSGAWRNANFLLSESGSVGTTTGFVRATITALADGWYRCEASFSNRTNALVVIGVSTADEVISYAGSNSGAAIYLWGAQLSDSASLDTYVPVYGAAVTSAAYYAPRLDFDPVTLAARGLLVEELRTNLIRYSRTLETTSSYWANLASGTANTITVDNAAGPDGAATSASLLTFNTAVPAGAGTDYSVWRHTLTTTANGTYTFSVWMKAGTTSSVYLFFNDSAGNRAVTQCTLTSNWQRFTVTGTTVASITGITVDIGGSGFFSSPVAAGTIYIYGAQLEAGAFSTSYIPNGSAVAGATRAADVASVSTQAFPYSSTAGSIVAAFDSIDATSGIVGDQTGDTAMLYSDIRDLKTYNGTSIVAVANNWALNAATKGAMTYDAAGRAVSLSGGTVATASGVLQNVTRFDLGRGFASVYLNGHIRQITYIPRRLSNAELQSRTA